MKYIFIDHCFPCCLSEFNEPQLSEADLSCLITKLNVNLSYFCLVAGVKELYHHNHTMKNLMLLLNHIPIT